MYHAVSFATVACYVFLCKALLLLKLYMYVSAKVKRSQNRALTPNIVRKYFTVIKGCTCILVADVSDRVLK